MPEQEVKAGELNKAEEVLDVVFPSGDETATKRTTRTRSIKSSLPNTPSS
jgi:hypothetical protein